MSTSAIERGIRPEIRLNLPILRRAVRWSSLTAAGFLGLSQVLAGCASPKEAINVTVGPQATATATAGGAEAAGLTPTATPEAQKPTTPEAPNTLEGIEKTILVPKDFRSSAELLQRKGTNSFVLGFKLKEGTSLPAAFPEGILPDGEIRKSKAPAPYNGLHLQIINPKNPTAPRITLIGDIVVETMLNEDVKDIKAIGKIGNTGATNIDGFNLIITITKQTQPGQFVTDVETIKRYFPEAYSKGSKEFVITAGTSHAINDTFN